VYNLFRKKQTNTFQNIRIHTVGPVTYHLLFCYVCEYL